MEGFRSVPFFAVAFDREPSGISFDDQIDAAGADGPLGVDAVAGVDESLEDLFFKDGFGFSALFLHGSDEGLRVARVFDQAAAEVAGLEVGFGVEGMDDPELVARAADGDIVAFFEKVLRSGVALGVGAFVWRAVHHGQEDDIAFVALELGCVAAEQAVFGENIRGDAGAQFAVDENGLLVAEERDDSEARGASGFVDFVFLVVEAGDEQRGDFILWM